MKCNLCLEVRQAILKQQTPFCISDLYNRLKSLTDDRNLILQCLDELYARKLVDYKSIKENLWAFVVT